MRYLHIQNLYFTKGFPFACILNKRTLFTDYDIIYKRALERAISDLDELYRSGGKTITPIGLRTAFAHLGINPCQYSELIDIALESDATLHALFPVQYNMKNFQSKVFKKPWEVANFLHDFLPLYGESRIFRNRVTHKAQATPDDLKDAFMRVDKCLEMLRTNQPE